MEYAIFTGGDVGASGSNAVHQLNNIFDFAYATNKGMLVFIDEAEAFLRHRS